MKRARDTSAACGIAAPAFQDERLRWTVLCAADAAGRQHRGRLPIPDLAFRAGLLAGGLERMFVAMALGDGYLQRRQGMIMAALRVMAAKCPLWLSRAFSLPSLMQQRDQWTSIEDPAPDARDVQVVLLAAAVFAGVAPPFLPLLPLLARSWRRRLRRAAALCFRGRTVPVAVFARELPALLALSPVFRGKTLPYPGASAVVIGILAIHRALLAASADDMPALRQSGLVAATLRHLSSPEMCAVVTRHLCECCAVDRLRWFTDALRDGGVVRLLLGAIEVAQNPAPAARLLRVVSCIRGRRTAKICRELFDECAPAIVRLAAAARLAVDRHMATEHGGDAAGCHCDEIQQPPPLLCEGATAWQRANALCDLVDYAAYLLLSGDDDELDGHTGEALTVTQLLGDVPATALLPALLHVAAFERTPSADGRNDRGGDRESDIDRFTTDNRAVNMLANLIEFGEQQHVGIVVAAGLEGVLADWCHPTRAAAQLGSDEHLELLLGFVSPATTVLDAAFRRVEQHVQRQQERAWDPLDADDVVHRLLTVAGTLPANAALLERLLVLVASHVDALIPPDVLRPVLALIVTVTRRLGGRPCVAAPPALRKVLVVLAFPRDALTDDGENVDVLLWGVREGHCCPRSVATHLAAVVLGACDGFGPPAPSPGARIDAIREIVGDASLGDADKLCRVTDAISLQR
jgi:hypothetical protein